VLGEGRAGGGYGVFGLKFLTPETTQSSPPCYPLIRTFCTGEGVYLETLLGLFEAENHIRDKR